MTGLFYVGCGLGAGTRWKTAVITHRHWRFLRVCRGTAPASWGNGNQVYCEFRIPFHSVRAGWVDRQMKTVGKLVCQICQECHRCQRFKAPLMRIEVCQIVPLLSLMGPLQAFPTARNSDFNFSLSSSDICIHIFLFLLKVLLKHFTMWCVSGTVTQTFTCDLMIFVLLW